MTLYRAVSGEEFADLSAGGIFRCPAGTLEVKWFAEQQEHAGKWGRRFTVTDGKMYRIIEVEIPLASLPISQRVAMLDGIGPAWWLSLDQLAGATIREVLS